MPYTKGHTELAQATVTLDRLRPAIRVGAVVMVASLMVVWVMIPDHQLRVSLVSGLAVFPVVAIAVAFSRITSLTVAGAVALALAVAVVRSPISYLPQIPLTLLIPASAWVISTFRILIRRQLDLDSNLDQQRIDLEAALDIAYRQVRFAEAMAVCARVFLGGRADLDHNRALQEVLAATEVDTVFLARNVSEQDGGLMSVAEHWVHAPGAPDPAFAAEISWTELPSAASRLSSGRDHRFSRLEDIPYPDRHVFERTPATLRSLLEVPINVDGRWAGILSIASHREGRRWKPNEVDLLRTLADIIGASWERQLNLGRLGEAIDQRDRSLKLQAALTELSRSLLESGSEGGLGESLEVIRSAVGVDTAYVIQNAVDPNAGPCFSAVATASAKEGMPATIEMVPWAARPYAYAELSSGRPYIIDDIDDLPDRERSWYMTMKLPIRAELNFPVMQDGEMVAVVGIADDAPRRWSATEMRTMGTVARMLAAHWNRDRIQRALEGLVRSKDRFLASVSHELRTPMAVVYGLSQELNERRPEFSEEEVDEFIDLIARQSREVAHIIEDLLVSARASETNLTVMPQTFRVDQQIREVITDLPHEHTFRIAGVDLDPVSVYADPLRVRQILRNLIINGHRYGGDQIFVRATTMGDDVVISVADNGAGIPPEQRDAIFEAYTTSSENDGRTAAIGLGLTVSRQLARLMGGDVTYRHEDMSCFDLRLPGSMAAMPTMPATTIGEANLRAVSR